MQGGRTVEQKRVMLTLDSLLWDLHAWEKEQISEKKENYELCADK